MPQKMSGPVHLGLLPEWPQPVPGCRVCAALAKQRERAAGSKNHTEVSDCNVEIRRHKDPHPERLR